MRRASDSSKGAEVVRRLCVPVIFVLLTVSCTGAGQVVSPPVETSWSAPLSVVDAYVEAFNAADSVSLFSLFGDDVYYSIRPWPLRHGETEAIAATLDVTGRGWQLDITETAAEGGLITGQFTFQTHGPDLTGRVEISVPAGVITSLRFDLDAESEAQLDSPDFYLRREPVFTALEGARAFFGDLGGALYQIEVPDRWNGGLVIYGNGFKEYALGLSVQPPPFSEYLIENGYAWAATSFSTNGFDPWRFTDDAAALHDFFVEEFGDPRYTYITGTSLGGLVTLLSLERFPGRYDGALAMCSVAGRGSLDFFGHYLVLAAYAAGVDQEGFSAASSLEQLVRDTIIPALESDPDARERFESLVAAVTGGPRPFRHEGFEEFYRSNFSTGLTVVEGGAFNNLDFSYPVDSPSGVTAAELNPAVVRIPGDAQTQEGDPSVLSGVVSAPLLMLHTTGDGLTPISGVQTFRNLADGVGDSGLLVQRAVRAPGHCQFSREEVETAIGDLTDWVENGIDPAGEDLRGSLNDAGRAFTDPFRDDDPGRL